MKTGYDRFFKVSQKQASAEKPSRGPIAPKPKAGLTHRQVIESKPTEVRRPRSFPWLAILVIGAISGLMGWYHESPEAVSEVVSKANSLTISVFGQAIAKDAVGKKIPDAPAGTEKKSGTEAVAAPVEPEKKKSWTDEEVALFRHLEARKKELDQKEETLKKLEEELQKQKDEVAMRLQQLEETRKKISGQLENKVQADLERVEKLVSFYSNMKPQSAAKVFQDLNEDLVVELLQKMKQKNAADIMNLLPAEKAQKLTERFAGYRRN